MAGPFAFQGLAVVPAVRYAGLMKRWGFGIWLALVFPIVAEAQDPFCNLVIGTNVLAADGTFLGAVNRNGYDPKSLANPYGQYGSPYQANSILNPYGQYGSRYSAKSPWYAYGSAQQVPLLDRPDFREHKLCRLSVNPQLAQPVCDPVRVLACIGVKPPQRRR